jgi:hypothetical protein
MISEKRLAANYIKITNRIIKKKNRPLKIYIKERQIFFFEFPKTIKTSLKSKIILAKIFQVNTVNTISIPFFFLLNTRLIYL